MNDETKRRLAMRLKSAVEVVHQAGYTSSDHSHTFGHMVAAVFEELSAIQRKEDSRHHLSA